MIKLNFACTGVLQGATGNKIPLTSFPAEDDDSYSTFCLARWAHYPVSDPPEWWKLLPLRWKVVTAEFGSKLRGMSNRIPKTTWIGAHDRY